MKQKIHEQGQTLVEAIIAVSVLVLLATGLVSGTTASLKASREGQTRSKAIKYAHEAMEFARRERDTGWAEFSQKNGVYCLGEDSVFTAAVSCTPNLENGFFTRSVTFSWLNPKMTVDVAVSWNDGGVIRSVDLTTYFTKWQ